MHHAPDKTGRFTSPVVLIDGLNTPMHSQSLTHWDPRCSVTSLRWNALTIRQFSVDLRKARWPLLVCAQSKKTRRLGSTEALCIAVSIYCSDGTHMERSVEKLILLWHRPIFSLNCHLMTWYLQTGTLSTSFAFCGQALVEWFHFKRSITQFLPQPPPSHSPSWATVSCTCLWDKRASPSLYVHRKPCWHTDSWHRSYCYGYCWLHCDVFNVKLKCIWLL